MFVVVIILTIAVSFLYGSFQITLWLFSPEIWGDEAIKSLNGLTLMFPLLWVCISLFVGLIRLLQVFAMDLGGRS